MKHTNLDDDSREITNAKAPRLAFLIVGAAILGLAYLLSGCQQLGQYERTYSVSYGGDDGKNASASLTLKPTKGLAK